MPTPTQYYLYLPVWATGQAPDGGGSSTLSSSSIVSTEWSGSNTNSTTPGSSANSTLESSSTPPGSSAQSTLESSSVGSSAGSSAGSSGGGSSGGGSSGGGSSGGGSSGGGSSGGGSSGGGSSGGGSSGGGSSGGGSSGGGSSGGGSSAGGSSGGGSSNCFLFGTLVTKADGSRVPIESLTPGDTLLSLAIPGLEPDADWQAQYDWRSESGLDGSRITSSPVGQITLGTHDGFYIINRRIKLTFEHPMLIRRADEWGFCAAELLQIGDQLIDGDLNEESITTIEHIDTSTRTVSLHIPGTNTYLAEGVWTHNDMAKAGGGSGFGINSGGSSGGGSGSGSGSGGKSSGSSFASSSGGGSSGLQSATSATGLSTLV